MRRALLVGAASLLAVGAVAVAGAATSLTISSRHVDAFSASQTATTVPSDATRPTVAPPGAEFFDNDADGKIEQIKVTFSEPLGSHAGAATDWKLSASRPTGMSESPSAVQISGSQVLLSWSTLSTNRATAATMTLSLTSSTAVQDLAGNFALPFSGQAVSDKAAPALVSLEAFDDRAGVAANGKIDRLAAVFSESLAPYTAETGPWTLDNAPGGVANTVSSVSVSGTTATLSLNEGAVNTAVGAGATAFRVDLAAGSTGIRDSAANTTSFIDAVVADKANPVFLDFTDSDTSGAGNGLIEDDDWIEFEFSEPIDLGTTADPANVKMDDNNSGTDRLAIQGLFGTTGLGSNGYITKQNKDADFNGSDLTQIGRKVRVELSSCTGNGCGDRGTSSGDITLTILSSVTGADGRSVIGAVTKTAYAMF